MNKNFNLLDLWSGVDRIKVEKIDTIKNFEIRDSLPGTKRIRAYENGKWIVDMILTDDNVNGACKILEALGYKLLCRAY